MLVSLVVLLLAAIVGLIVFYEGAIKEHIAYKDFLEHKIRMDEEFRK